MSAVHATADPDRRSTSVGTWPTILALHAAKRDLADDLLEGTEEGGRLSYEDMLALVG